MIASDKELEAAQARVQAIQSVLAHTRRTMAPEDFALQSKGWLREWERLDAEIHQYLSTPAPTAQLKPAVAS